MTTTVTRPDSIMETNPYELHPSLSALEADVLWEYAKLSQHVKEVRVGSSFIRK
jgi:DASH complex subunit DAD3